MENIHKAFKSLRTIYIIHIFIFSLIFVFNYVLIPQVYWLKRIYKLVYLITDIINLINLVLPIISLIYIGIKKLTKNNIKIFKNFTLFFCVFSILIGLFFSCILMMNAIESPEFCKECPFNLPITDINELIKSGNLNKKCNERRCIINSENYEALEKNENNLYEYICNYDPTSEFEETKENFDANDDIYIENNNNNSTNKDNYDSITCNKISEVAHIVSNGLENTYTLNFYEKCNSYTELYICERTKAPNVLQLGDNMVCPNQDYTTKLIIICIINVFINLMINFIPWKCEYNKYSDIFNMYHPRRNNIKSISFNSTLNSSKIPKEEKNNEDKFEKSPTEIIIVYSDTNSQLNNINNKANNDNNKNKNKEEHSDNKSNMIKKSSIKIINFNDNNNQQNQQRINFNNDKNKTEIKIINTINSINIINTKREENKESNSNEDEYKITMSFDCNNNITSSNRIILSDNKKSEI